MSKEVEQLPIPESLVGMVKKQQARRAIERMQVQLQLLAHLVGTLDPEHDYVFDDEKLTLTKVKRAEDGEVQPSDNQNKPFRGQVSLGGEAKGLPGIVSNKDAVEAEQTD